MPDNMIDESWFFTRWQYLDFLGAGPDQSGWDFWTDGLNRHGDYGETIRSFLFSDGYRSRFVGMH